MRKVSEIKIVNDLFYKWIGIRDTWLKSYGVKKCKLYNRIRGYRLEISHPVPHITIYKLYKHSKLLDTLEINHSIEHNTNKGEDDDIRH